MVDAGNSLMTERPLTIRVECYAGYRGEEEPRRFFIGEKPIEIETIIDRWLDPEYRYFKVRSANNDVYILRHDEQSNRWELTMFQSSRLADDGIRRD